MSISEPRELLAASAVDTAPAVLGAHLASDVGGRRVVVRLTEVEAYEGAKDPGSHAFRGETARNTVMFGPPGHAYVYFIYGMHWCMNVVCGPEGVASALLVRAGEIVEGTDIARERRGTAGRIEGAAAAARLASGPARLAQALGITGQLNGADLLDGRGPLHLVLQSPQGDAQLEAGPRVGVAGAGAPIPWRFWLSGDPTVSPYRAAVPRRRTRS